MTCGSAASNCPLHPKSMGMANAPKIAKALLVNATTPPNFAQGDVTMACQFVYLSTPARHSLQATPGAARIGCRRRQGVISIFTPVWRSIFQAA